MKLNIRPVVIGGVFLLCSGSGSLLAMTSLPGLCPSAPLAIYSASGFSCTLGGLTFEDFSFASFRTFGATHESAIIVSPIDDRTDVGFTFSGPFSVPAYGIGDYFIDFIALQAAPSIDGATASLVGAGLSPGSHIFLTATQCLSNAGYLCLESDSLTDYATGAGSKLSSSVVFAPADQVFVDLDLHLSGGSTLQSFSYRLDPGQSHGFGTTEAAEPPAILLVAGGLLLAIGGKASQARNRKHAAAPTADLPAPQRAYSGYSPFDRSRC